MADMLYGTEKNASEKGGAKKEDTRQQEENDAQEIAPKHESLLTVQ